MKKMQTAIEVTAVCSCCLERINLPIRIVSQGLEYLLLEFLDKNEKHPAILIHIRYDLSENVPMDTSTGLCVETREGVANETGE